MSAQHTPGPWEVFRALSEKGTPFGVQRSIRQGPYTCEQLKGANGKPARFATEAKALAAIAKAIGGAS